MDKLIYCGLRLTWYSIVLLYMKLHDKVAIEPPSFIDFISSYWPRLSTSGDFRLNTVRPPQNLSPDLWIHKDDTVWQLPRYSTAGWASCSLAAASSSLKPYWKWTILLQLHYAHRAQVKRRWALMTRKTPDVQYNVPPAVHPPLHHLSHSKDIPRIPTP